MKKKQGISLIVLVITIIVMIILAASVVITLSNTGIINKANTAVNLSNEKQVQDLASMIWAEAYLDKNRTDTIEKVVKDKLAEQGVTDEKWDITVSATGVSVTTKKETEWPITWNMADITNNTSVGGAYKISDTAYTLMEDEFKILNTQIESTNFKVMCVQTVKDGAIQITVYAEESEQYQLFVFAVPEGDATSQMLGTTFQEAGLYVMDAIGNLSGQDIDLTLRDLEKVNKVETIQDSWSDVKAHINAGDYETRYKIGDTKILKLTNDFEILMEIVAFNADVKNDGTKTAITWISKYPSVSKCMNSNGSNVGGWKETDVRKWLQSDFYNLLPSEVKGIISAVNKTYYDYTTKSTLTSEDTIWLPSYREVFGGSDYETSGVEYTDYFKDTESRIKVNEKFLIPMTWWLRTTGNNSNSSFKPVSSSGEHAYNNYAADAVGIVIGFCM